MKIKVIFLALALLSNSASASFLWAKKEFWIKSHKDWKMEIKTEKPPFISEIIEFTPPSLTFLGSPMFRTKIVVIGDRVMAYTMVRADEQQMTLENIQSCMEGASKIGAPWQEPKESDVSLTWMRGDNKVIVDFYKKVGMVAIYDAGFYMLDKTMNEANSMKENGMGDDAVEILERKLKNGGK